MNKKLQYRIREALRDLTRLLLWAMISAAAFALIIGAGLNLTSAHTFSDIGETAVAIAGFLLTMAVMWFALGWSADITQYMLGPPKPAAFVEVSGETIVSSGIDKETEDIRWEDLIEVGIIASDAWPIGDLNWVLLSSEGSGAVIPSTAEGMDRLLAAMQERLAGFDNRSVIEAMACIEGRFVVWRKTLAPESDTI